MNTTIDGATILVVDDSAVNLRLLEALLGESGYRVLAFPDGQMAIRAAGKRAPDLVLLDALMPGLSGFEVCARLKRLPGMEDVPVLFISGLTDPADRANAYTAGGADFITKPFQYDEVRARVRLHLELAAHRRRAAVEQRVMRGPERTATAALGALLAELHRRGSVQAADPLQVGRVAAALGGALAAAPHPPIDCVPSEHLLLAAAARDIGQLVNEPASAGPDGDPHHVEDGAAVFDEALRALPGDPGLVQARAVALHHHEAWDGTGYPDRLSGDGIPFAARVVAVADAWCHSRRLFGAVDAARTVEAQAGTRFDPRVVETLLHHLAACERACAPA